jgi:hypothetical protein
MAPSSSFPYRGGASWWQKEWLAWLIAGLWSLLIFVTVPFVRVMQVWVADQIGSHTFFYGTVVVVAAAAVAAVVLGKRWRGSISLRSLLWIGLPMLTVIGWSMRLWHPEEAVHFVEYGVLGVLLYMALRHRAADRSVFISAALLGATVGTVDEIIQWITPNRIFDHRDLLLNAGAGCLVQITIWQGVAPLRTQNRPRPQSLRIACRFAILLVLLLGLSLSATPSRIDRMAQRLDWLSPLATSNDVMAEYGFRHVDPQIGTFKSRFTIEQLHRLDREQAAAFAEALRRYQGKGKDSYQSFLESYGAARAPFIHEVRVHLFARNRNLNRAMTEPEAPELRERMTTAYRENQILETYFPTIFEQSGRLGRHRRLALDRAELLDEPFVSQVSVHLITSFSELQMQIGVLLLLGLLLAFDIWLGRLGKDQQEPP